MAAALSEAGVETLLVTTDADGPGSLPVETGQPVTYAGARTVFFPRLRGESLKPSPALARWLRRHSSSFEVVHVHSVFSHPSLAAGAAARRARVPYVVRPLGQLDPWSLAQHPFRKRLFLVAGGRRLLERSAALHWTDAMEKEGAPTFLSKRPGFVVPLGVDEALFGSSSAEERRQVVLFLSRLHPKKNVEGLIDAFLSAGPRFAAWKLVVAGEGESRYEAALKAIVHRRGAEGQVEFAGWLAGEEKLLALREAALLALPSRQENFGIVVAEAMAAGTPVVISEKVALAVEVARSGAGWVVPVEGDGLRAALVMAMDSADERRRRGAAARQLAEGRFRWGGVAASLIQEYEVLLRRAGEEA